MKCPNCKNPIVKVCSECGYTLTPYNILLGKKFRLDKKDGTGFYYRDNIVKIKVKEESEKWKHFGFWSFELAINDGMNEIYYGDTRHFDSISDIIKYMSEWYGCKVIFQTQKTLFSNFG